MFRLFFPLLAIATIAACSRDTWSDVNVEKGVPEEFHKALQEPDRVTFYTVMNPLDSPDAREQIERMPKLHYMGILGSQELTREEGRELIDTFIQAVKKGTTEAAASCFNPHHVIRVEGAGKTVDIIVCFECQNFEVTPGGKLNAVVFNDFRPMYDAWMAVVAKYGLKDLSKRLR